MYAFDHDLNYLCTMRIDPETVSVTVDHGALHIGIKLVNCNYLFVSLN